MKGLTDRERQELLEMSSPGIVWTSGPEDPSIVVLWDLVAQGRAAHSVDGDGADVFDITETGRLALKLWPSNRAPP